MTGYTPNIHPWNQEIWQNLTLEPERANHALLFNGDKGLGKRDLAFALAHFVLTDNNAQSERLFNAGSHPDLHIIMPECELGDDMMSEYAKRYIDDHSGKPRRAITIDQVRRLGGALTTHPHIAQHRVIIIPFADTMNASASNALLKNLEEPPTNTLFILVTDEISRLVNTIRSRCSLINFRTPALDSASAWVKYQNVIPEDQTDTYLAIANNRPLEAMRFYQEGYLDSLKTIFTDVNNLWMNRAEVTLVAKKWQEIGGSEVVDILQKLVTDLVRCKLTASPATVFFPVQKPWIDSSSTKLSKKKLLSLVDELNYAKRMLSTTVDELLVLETLTNRVRLLPA